ncbi:MAG: NAD(P)H-dependent oxidoreductase [Eubacteriales bacterium]
MCKVLYIKAHTGEKSEDPFMLSDHFVEEYKKYHPNDQVTTLDLNKEKIRTLTRNDILSAIVHKEDRSRSHPVLKYAWQFAEADKYIVAEPFCDSGIPAILNYMDYVSIMDIAFKYTEYGSVGLLKGKKAVNFISRGGERGTKSYSFNELGEENLKSIFLFFGITDFTTIDADQLDDLGDEAERRARCF